MEESVQQQAMEREAMHKEIAALEEQAAGAEDQIAKLAAQVLELEEKVGRRNPWLETGDCEICRQVLESNSSICCHLTACPLAH
jgi:hypothetical protein